MTNTLELAKSNGHAQVASHTDATRQEYTFPSSGLTAVINKVSLRRTTDHRDAMRRMDEAKGLIPHPPTQDIDVAGEMVTQENPADPDYLLAFQKYEDELDLRELDWFAGRVLTPDVDAVKEYRAKSLAEDGTDYPDLSDAHIYLWHIVCLNMQDYREFYSLAVSLSAPTPAAIADAKRRF